MNVGKEITTVDVPNASFARRSHYLKVRDLANIFNLTKRHLLVYSAIASICLAISGCTNIGQDTDQAIYQASVEPALETFEESSTGDNILIIARIYVKQGIEEKLKQELLRVAGASLAEPGCIDYDVHQSLNNKQLFVLYTTWESREALVRHFQTPEYQRLTRITKDMLAAPTKFLMFQSEIPRENVTQ